MTYRALRGIWLRINWYPGMRRKEKNLCKTVNVTIESNLMLFRKLYSCLVGNLNYFRN